MSDKENIEERKESKGTQTSFDEDQAEDRVWTFCQKPSATNFYGFEK